MKLFRCDHCGQTLYFENVVCQNCGRQLGYLPDRNELVSLDPTGGDAWTTPAAPGKTFVFCVNSAEGACNWLLEREPGGPIYCRACRHNETIPPLTDGLMLSQWQTIERAKHRLMYSLIRFGLPLETRAENPAHGLGFRFLADVGGEPVMTGHESGIITIALAEADDAERERRRTAMGEPYRTLLGHFRHEIGHHYWDLLVSRGPALDAFRTLFGDERTDYAQALEQHYAAGPPADWQQQFVSAYATSHPWEDFAETWAHFMHITDTIEVAGAFGVNIAPVVDTSAQLVAAVDFDPYRPTGVDALMEVWVPLASLLNNLNRSMGMADAYPFVLTPRIIDKLAFVQRLIAGNRGLTR